MKRHPALIPLSHATTTRWSRPAACGGPPILLNRRRSQRRSGASSPAKPSSTSARRRSCYFHSSSPSMSARAARPSAARAPAPTRIDRPAPAARHHRRGDRRCHARAWRAVRGPRPPRGGATAVSDDRAASRGCPELQPRLRDELEAAASDQSRGAALASDELNATPLSWKAGTGPPEHVNEERDVLGVVLDGSATLSIDGEERELARGESAIVAKGSTRKITAGGEAAAPKSTTTADAIAKPTQPSAGGSMTNAVTSAATARTAAIDAKMSATFAFAPQLRAGGLALTSADLELRDPHALLPALRRARCSPSHVPTASGAYASSRARGARARPRPRLPTGSCRPHARRAAPRRERTGRPRDRTRS
jgi:quercetin dioxygenase-like cupin family protein